uniref:Uncharacterized protein n=1 Tax=Timema douglasi TaxID=61478 RepID=A0A7R8ZCQ0_TIMDO|nr:unnamed protein product [Timema douglasi]
MDMADLSPNSNSVKGHLMRDHFHTYLRQHCIDDVSVPLDPRDLGFEEVVNTLKPQKNIERRELATFTPDYEDPLAGPYTEYLVPVDQWERLPEPKQFEHPDTCLARVSTLYCVTVRFENDGGYYEHPDTCLARVESDGGYYDRPDTCLARVSTLYCVTVMVESDGGYYDHPDTCLARVESDGGYYDHPDTCLARIFQRNPRLKLKHDTDPPDREIISHIKDDNGKSVYQVEICHKGDKRQGHGLITLIEQLKSHKKLSKGDAPVLGMFAGKEFFSEKIRKQQRVPLPDGWVIPATIQRASYRDTRFFGKLMDIQPHRRDKPDDNLRSGGNQPSSPDNSLRPGGEWRTSLPSLVTTSYLVVSRESVFQADDNLIPGDKMRTLVKVQTGDTEYQGEIGRVGRLIISERLCGEFPKRRNGTNPWDLARRQEELLHHVND